MPSINTEELLDRIADGRFKAIRVWGAQDGTFYLLLDDEDGTFIHERRDGQRKEYRRVEDVLDWLKRKTKLTRVVVDIALYKSDIIKKSK